MLYESKVITAAIHENFGLDISLRSRRREIVDARQAVFNAMREIGSTTRIAECFNMDHSTVVVSMRHHETRYEEDRRKRLKHFELYCTIYDFTMNLIKEKNFDEYHSILNVRDELSRQRVINEEISEVLKKTESDLRKAKKQIEELRKYKIAFKQQMAQLNAT